jgi:hypothetical protein
MNDGVVFLQSGNSLSEVVLGQDPTIIWIQGLNFGSSGEK